MSDRSKSNRVKRIPFARTALVIGVASMLAAPAAYSKDQATAVNHPIQAAAAKTDTAATEFIKFSEDGNRAIREIRGARIAIFNGDTKVALKLMEKAKADVGSAEKDAPVYSTKTTVTENGKQVASESQHLKAINVPVDATVVLADSFVVTPEKKARIDKANKAFKKGDHKQAIDELRQGEIDVSYTRWMMPLASTHQRLDRAIKLARDEKYYEANLELKAIEDSLVTETLILTALPKKG